MNKEDNKKIMAKNITYYMSRRGIDNQQFCADLDIPYTTLKDWLTAVSYPRIGKIELMANYFGCKKSDLIEDKPESQRQTEESARRAARIAKDPNLVEIIDMYTALPEDKKKTVKQVLVDYYKAFANG